MTEYEQRVRDLVRELQIVWSLTERFCECPEIRVLRHVALSRHSGPEGKALNGEPGSGLLVTGAS